MSVLSGFGFILYPCVFTFSCWSVCSRSVYLLCWLFKGKESSPLSQMYLLLFPSCLCFTWAMAIIWGACRGVTSWQPMIVTLNWSNVFFITGWQWSHLINWQTWCWLQSLTNTNKEPCCRWLRQGTWAFQSLRRLCKLLWEENWKY